MQADRNDAVRSWAKIVEELRRESGLSQDDLAHNARGYGAPQTLTGSQISQIKHGKRPYSTGFLEGIAGALGISPFRFAEYHLALARELLDERIVGLDGALRNLDRLPELISVASEAAQTSADQTLEETRAAIDLALDSADEAAGQKSEGQVGHTKRGRV